METNKFEKYIEKILKEREITPTVGAWDRISGQMESNRKAKRKGYYWYAIAASFIGLLMTSIIFLKTDIAPKDSQSKIVNSQNDIIDIKKNEEITINENEESLSMDKNTRDLDTSNDQKGSITKRPELAKPDLNKMLILGSEIAKNAELETKDEGFDSERKVVLEEKIAEVLAKVNLLEAIDNAALSNIEVDSLLRNAQQELLSNKIFNENRSVDAIALLNEVEGELDQSFRSQIFQTLKNGFLKARTAVADRNN